MVLAIENSDRLITNPPPNSLIDKQAVLHMLGDEDQRDRFNKFF
jgi:K+/H+ antiporter YhaU regulatory subunit KhtT